jgi:hypothetical protein
LRSFRPWSLGKQTNFELGMSGILIEIELSVIFVL